MQSASRALSRGMHRVNFVHPEEAKRGLQRAVEGAAALLADKRSLASRAVWKALPHSCACLTATVSPSTHLEQCLEVLAAEGNMQGLSDAWERRHQALPPQPKRANVRAHRVHPCCLVGVCHCRAGSWAAGVFAAKKLATWVREAFPGKAGSTELCRGMVCLVIARRNRNQRDSDDLEGLPEPDDIRILHIALQYLKPWRSTYIELEAATPRDRKCIEDWAVLGVQAPASTYVTLALREAEGSRPTVISNLTFFRSLNLSQAWLVGAAQLSSRERPFPNSEGMVKLKLDGMQTVCFWKGEEAEEECKKLRAAKARAARLRPHEPSGGPEADRGPVDFEKGFEGLNSAAHDSQMLAAEDEDNMLDPDELSKTVGPDDEEEEEEEESQEEPDNELSLASLQVEFPEHMLELIQKAAEEEGVHKRLRHQHHPPPRAEAVVGRQKARRTPLPRLAPAVGRPMKHNMRSWTTFQEGSKRRVF